MESSDSDREKTNFAAEDTFEARQAALRRRVAEAARVLTDQGIRPTVARIRAALGGGSPNDLAPALKAWKDSIQTHSWDVGRPSPLPIPAQIADLAHEIWQRATAAAVVEVKGGPAARDAIHRDEEVLALQAQVTALRDQLQRESLGYGELRAQAARHEAVARDALARFDAAASRERSLLRDLGGARQRIAELEATVEALRSPPDAESPRSPRKPAKRAAPHTKKRPSKQSARHRKTRRTARSPDSRKRTRPAKKRARSRR